MARLYTLEPSERERLERALAGCLVNPFVHDILDFNWEAIWHYCKGLRVPDPVAETRKKILHDAVDSRNGIGWSLKTQQITSSIADCANYWVVIARADIFGRAAALGFPGLSRSSSVHDLGRAILKIWHDKVAADSKLQGVRESRVATLLKAPDRTEFGVHETDLATYHPKDLKWTWGKTGKGLWATKASTGDPVYRWYPSGGQLFELFQVPKEILVLRLKWHRLDPDDVLSKLEELAGSLEGLVNQRSKR